MIEHICIPEEGKDGKTYWNRIGKLITSDNGKKYVKIYHIAGLCSVFEDKKREAQPTPKAEVPSVDLNGKEMDF